MDASEEKKELSVDVTLVLRLEGEVNEAQRQGGEHKEESQKEEPACAKALWCEEPRKASVAKALRVKGEG